MKKICVAVLAFGLSGCATFARHPAISSALTGIAVAVLAGHHETTHEMQPNVTVTLPPLCAKTPELCR